MAVPTDTAQRSRQATRLGLGVSAVYAVFGLAWILLSDAALAVLARDVPWLTSAQSAKGLAFIIVTSIGLALIVRQSHLRRMRSDDKAAAHELQTLGLFARHPQPMWVFEKGSLAFLAVNDTAVERYGYSMDEFLAMTLKDINPKEDAARVEQLTSDPLTGPRVVGRVRHVKKSGEVIFAHVSVHPVQYAGRTATMAMSIDVTAEVLAANAVRRKEEQYRELHQSLGEVLWLAEASDFKVIYVSAAFEQVYGRPCSELLANPPLWLEVVLPEDRWVATASNEQLRTLGHASCEYRILRPDGAIRWISDRKNVIKDDEGLESLVGGIAEDITALKQWDAERANAQAQLEQTVAERTAELAAVNMELDAFTRTAAHDLKTPLNAVSGNCHLIRRRFGDALGADGLQMLGKIERSSQHMARLVDDLLTLSRVGAKDLELREIDLSQLARSVMEGLLEQDPGRTVQLEAPAKLLVQFDPGLAASLLSNLLGNAWKFTSGRPDARIEISARTLDEATVIAIEDNGVGFDSAAAPAVFRPFQRFHSLSQFSGTGVGLVTCQRILRRHGGDIRIASSAGHGTVVELTIPHSQGRR